MDDSRLEELLYPVPVSRASEPATPDWVVVHTELKRKGVTLQLLWEEYKERHAYGWQYSWFCGHYQEYAKKLNPSMRQAHKAGEKLFVDYAGQTVPIVDRETGEAHAAQIFVGVLGASSYTYAEGTWTQSLPDWIGSHVRAFEYFGGVPEIVVPDNLKSGVTKPCRYEPDINPTYQEMAMHYGVAVLPARIKKPRDKAKVEAGVQLVERWILARLRHRTFFSLTELNIAIRELLERLNGRPFRKLPGQSRWSLFETLEKPALRPLPAQRYEYAQWKKARVSIDYHIEVEGHYYSVPYKLVREEVEVRLAGATVEVFYKSNRIASHPRSHVAGRHTTVKDHMPKAHQRYGEWSPSRIIKWAAKTGPNTALAVEKIMASRPHPEQGYRSCLGLLRLEKDYGPARLEAACQRALALNVPTYQSVKSILKEKLDRQPLFPAEELPVIEHPHIRGSDYYQ
jgi:transposase